MPQPTLPSKPYYYCYPKGMPLHYRVLDQIGALLPFRQAKAWSVPPSATPISRLFDAQPQRVMLAGLECAGKSTLLRTHLGQDAATRAGQVPLVEIIPTIGVKEEEVWFGRGTCFCTLDLGQPKVRSLEWCLIARCDAVIWVMDAAGDDFLVDSMEKLTETVLHPNGLAKDAPLLGLLNKQGQNKPITLKVEDIEKKIAPVVGTRNWHIAETDGLSGDGLLESFQWLSNALGDGTAQELNVMEGLH